MRAFLFSVFSEGYLWLVCSANSLASRTCAVARAAIST